MMLLATFQEYEQKQICEQREIRRKLIDIGFRFRDQNKLEIDPETQNKQPTFHKNRSAVIDDATCKIPGV